MSMSKDTHELVCGLLDTLEPPLQLPKRALGLSLPLVRVYGGGAGEGRGSRTGPDRDEGDRPPGRPILAASRVGEGSSCRNLTVQCVTGQTVRSGGTGSQRLDLGTEGTGE